MSQQGKFSDAFARAGEAKKLSEQPHHPPSWPKHTTASSPPPASAAVERKPPEAEPFRRVKDRCGPPVPSAVMFHDRAGEVSTQIRSLRAKLMAMNHGHPPRAITISSGTREEGKSTIAFNMAAALSEVTPGRVVLVDGDTLRPALQIVANIRPQTGLNEIIEGEDLPLDNNVYETRIPNLDVIPTRPSLPSNGSETTIHRICRGLIDKLRQYYDFVLIDTPPVMASTHAALFGKHTDGAIVVARVERTPRHVVKRAINELSNAGVSVIGCILTHQKHHVPDFIYRFFGTTPHRYYKYGSHQYARQSSENAGDQDQGESDK